MLGDIGPGEVTFAFRRAAAAEGEQARQPAVSGAVAGQAKRAGAIFEIKPGADQQANVGLLGCRMGAHHAGQGIAVAHRQSLDAERRRRRHQLMGMRGAFQKAEIADGLQLGIGGHGSCVSFRPIT